MSTLGSLPVGERGIVRRVGDADARIRQRLTDMGITPLTEITVVKIAPLGDPIEISLRGYSLSVRREDAAHIELMEKKEAESALQAEQRIRAEAERSAHDTLMHSASDEDDSGARRSAAHMTEWLIQSGGYSCPAGGCAACAGCGLIRPGGKKKNEAHMHGAGGRHYSDESPVRIALLGNPNSCKTTLFNALTGAKEYVGNWPGVTVEKKERRFSAFGHDMTVVDLPGIYSLSTYSMEEIVSRNFLLDERPDAIINIIDATNLERNLYLTMQLIELETPIILALNMMDEVRRSGLTIDCPRLSLELGVPIVPISARTGEGVDDLIRQSAALISAAHEQLHRGYRIEPDRLCDAATHAAHHRIGTLIGDASVRAGLPRHFAEIKLLEADPLIEQRLQLDRTQAEAVERIRAEYAGGGLNDAGTRMADGRYRTISHITKLCVKRAVSTGKTATERIDAVLTNRYAGIPIFLLIMGAIFLLTFDTLGGWLSDGVDALINGLLSPWLSGVLEGAHAAPWLISLICEGIVSGVGGVLVFLPQIALLFFFLSLLEDSGYMSRTAFLMDRALKRFGLSGKSFIPMLMGFGCTVPAVLAARTMENESDRRMTILLLPFISCSAKLPVYGMIASVFFDNARGLVVLSLYLVGIVVGIITGILFKKTLFQQNNATFLMELPPYRLPSMKNTLLHVSERVGHFLEKAGTIIFFMSIVLWFLTRFDLTFALTEQTQNSILGVLGGWIAPVFRPLGFGTWEASVALLTGVVAKEAVVSSLALFIGASGDALSAALTGMLTPVAAYSFLVFVLLYVPCMAAMATMRRELHSAKYMWFSVLYQLMTAYLVSLLVYRLGSLML